MANTTLSSVGGKVIQGNWTDEHIVGALGDGSATAGMPVGVIQATGYVVACGSAGTDDSMVGLLMENYSVDCDTAITAAAPCSIVVPQSGHLYAVKTADMGATYDVQTGYAMIHDATDGQFTVVAGGIEDEHVARMFRGQDDDTVQIVMWQ
jgi:hypothetical protein